MGELRSMSYTLESISCSVVSNYCNPMDCNPPGSFVSGISQAKNSGVGCYCLLQEIFLTQGSNLGLLHWGVDSLLPKPPEGAN